MVNINYLTSRLSETAKQFVCLVRNNKTFKYEFFSFTRLLHAKLGLIKDQNPKAGTTSTHLAKRLNKCTSNQTPVPLLRLVTPAELRGPIPLTAQVEIQVILPHGFIERSGVPPSLVGQRSSCPPVLGGRKQVHLHLTYTRITLPPTLH